MPYTTIYTRKAKPRGHFETTTRGCAYTTKSLTPFHAHIRATYPDAQTWLDPKRVITNLTPGMNLGMLPIIAGGTRIA